MTVAAIGVYRGIFVDGPIGFSVDEILKRDVDRALDKATHLDIIIAAHVDYDPTPVPGDLLEDGIGGGEAPVFGDAGKHLVDDGSVFDVAILFNFIYGADVEQKRWRLFGALLGGLVAL